MNVLDLFSGIGGFSLGLERAGFHTVQFVEIDSYCRRVLAKHWPSVPCHDDIRTFDGIPLRGMAKVICGGFPCQDISRAGYGDGITGERSGLWKEYARIVGEVRPEYVLVENVAALLDRGIDVVCGDLADIGYDAEWSVISACSIGAPHLRQRVFLVAYPNSLNGRPRVWNTEAQEYTPLQAIDSFKSSRTDFRTRMADPSSLYGKADGLPFGMDRNRALGNAIVPQIAQIIGEAVMQYEAHKQAG